MIGLLKGKGRIAESCLQDSRAGGESEAGGESLKEALDEGTSSVPQRTEGDEPKKVVYAKNQFLWVEISQQI